MLEPGDHAFGETFQGLEHNVANKPVANHHVDPIVKEIVSLHVANKVDVDLATKSIRLLRQLRPFVLLRAVTKEPNPRALAAEDRPGVDAAHHRVVNELFGTTLDAGARVQEDETAFGPWNHSCNADALDACERP